MAINLAFRRNAVRSLTNEVGVYVLCDLDQIPIYVGQSSDGIRARVRRHLTSARSDIIRTDKLTFGKSLLFGRSLQRLHLNARILKRGYTTVAILKVRS